MLIYSQGPAKYLASGVGTADLTEEHHVHICTAGYDPDHCRDREPCFLHLCVRHFDLVNILIKFHVMSLEAVLYYDIIDTFISWLI